MDESFSADASSDNDYGSFTGANSESHSTSGSTEQSSDATGTSNSASNDDASGDSSSASMVSLDDLGSGCLVLGLGTAALWQLIKLRREAMADKNQSES